jgi:acyl dehydratase
VVPFGALCDTFYQLRPEFGQQIFAREVRMPQRVIDGVVELRGLVGQEVGVSDWLTVTQERINAFAELTEDRQWIHCDPARARAESPYKTTIAHGFLTLSLWSHLASQAVRVRGPFSRVINYGLNRVRFPAAVPAGGRIRARCTLQAVEEVPGGLQVAWAVTMECEGQPKPVMVAESLSRYYSDTESGSS